VRTSARAVALAISWLALLASLADAELIQEGNLLVDFDGRVHPKALPRHGTAPVTLHLRATISTTDGGPAPQLDEMLLDVNRHGQLTTAGLPRCRRSQIAFTTTQRALANCRGALVGRGDISANIALPEQAPLPSEGIVLAFNGREHGRPVIYAHIYGRTPLPITTVVTFHIRRMAGRFGIELTAQFPRVAADWGFVKTIRLTLGRRYQAGGQRRSYLSAACPTPRGVNRALFTMARGTYTFEDGRRLTSSLVRACRARR
jgi:hypothetical protein